MICVDCGSNEHLNYQCKHNIDLVLATYNITNGCNASMKVLEHMLFLGALEIIVPIRNIKVSNKTLDTIYGTVHASVEDFHERITTALEKNELVQDSQKT